MIKQTAAIFDIDGTLVDSVDLHASAWKDAFEEFGHRLDFKNVRAQIGKGADQLMPVFLSHAEIDRMGKSLEQRRGQIFHERYFDRVKGFAHVRALFERLLSDGKVIALASSAKQNELGRYEQIAGIDDLPLVKISSDDVGLSKPHPDIFQAVLRQLNIDHDAAIVVGDTPYDAEAAAKAGLSTIGMLCGGWSENELRRAGCIAIYADPSDLLLNYQDSPFAKL